MGDRMTLSGNIFSGLILLLLVTAAGCGDSTVSDNTAPGTPTNLTATAGSSSSIKLSWDSSTDNVGVTGYKIYSNGSYLNTVTTKSASDTGLSTYTQYCYSVAAVDAANNESAQTTPVCTNTNPKFAKVVISTAWPLANGTPPAIINIETLNFTLSFPFGVTPKSIDPYGLAFEESGGIWTTLKVAGRIVGPISPPPASAPSFLNFLPATATTPEIVYYNKGTGLIGLGKFLTIFLEVEAGRNITGADFNFLEFSAKDSLSVPISVVPSPAFSYL